MSGISRRTLVNEVGGLILFSFLPISSAKAAQLVDLRIWPSPEYTRITLEHDVPIPFKYTMVRNGSSVKMVVLIEGLTLTTKLKNLVSKQQPNDPYISGITASQYSSKTVQLVINFKQDVDPQVFSLKPFGEYKYRLVFDLYPAVEKDPIMALIRKEESEPDAIGRILAQVAEGQQRMEENRAEAEQDSIGDLIAGITSGNIVPMKPGDLGYTEQPSKEKPKSSKAPVTKQPKKEQPKTTPRRGRVRILVVMVDPGHGGEDPGAVGKRYRTKEKEVVLSISRILVAELNKVQGFKAMLTRDRDYFVPLNRRVQKARAAKADFFVSVHADAWVKPTARGSSIFALDTRGRVSTQNKWLARNQNNADLIGGVNVTRHDKQIAKILLDMSFTAQVSDSLAYGKKILTELAKINTLHKSRVEQANFAVLKAPDIPSVLVETAFISNPQEEQKLRTRAFQRKVACAIGNGILKGFGRSGTLS